MTGKTAPLCTTWLYQTGKAHTENLLVLHIYLAGGEKWGWDSAANPTTVGEGRDPEKAELLQRRGRGCCGDKQIWECSSTKIIMLSLLEMISTTGCFPYSPGIRVYEDI